MEFCLAALRSCQERPVRVHWGMKEKPMGFDKIKNLFWQIYTFMEHCSSLHGCLRASWCQIYFPPWLMWSPWITFAQWGMALQPILTSTHIYLSMNSFKSGLQKALLKWHLSLLTRGLTCCTTPTQSHLVVKRRVPKENQRFASHSALLQQLQVRCITWENWTE